ncbi:MAG TPA: phytase [Acidimicrobiia bacterium]|nr:phytase [Acidimicrobiia bacterium]
MSATRSQLLPGSSRKTIGAALGLVLVVAAAPFLRPASAAQPTGDAPASVETQAITAGTTTDPAIWVNPTDPTRSLILGANKDAGLTVYGVDGTILDQPGVNSSVVTGVDTRDNVMVNGVPTSVATAVGNGLAYFYAIDPSNQKLTNVTSVTTGIAPPDWGQGSVSTVCMYQSPVTSNTYAFVLSANGQMEQLQLNDTAGKISVTTVRGYRANPSAGIWSAIAAPDNPGGCVADDANQVLYVSGKKTGIWKFGAEPDAGLTPTLVDGPSTGTPAGNLNNLTQGLALVKTGDTSGYLIASSPGDSTVGAPEADRFMVYDRAAGNAFIRSFHVITGAVDDCDNASGVDAAVGAFSPAFPSGIFACQNRTDQNAGTKNGLNNSNYTLVPLQLAVDTAAPDTTTTTVTTPTTLPPVQVPSRSGYWMVGSDGKVYSFGDARDYGDVALPAGASAVDLEPTPSGNGYWIVDDFGHVYNRGDAPSLGDVDRSLLSAGEVVTSLSSTKSGHGYWVFTTLGRVIPFGDATFLGDMTKTKLNGPVLDSIPSASGDGYYMVASDGGIFTFGDAVYQGSMGDKKLNAPVQSLVPDADGSGYWLVASDGGIFAFDAPFRGSMGAIKLNKPVTGMVRYGNGYLMVAADGGIFSFSDQKFAGSLGDNPPKNPITSVAVLDAPVAL